MTEAERRTPNAERRTPMPKLMPTPNADAERRRRCPS
jgi:hypothetical protein